MPHCSAPVMNIRFAVYVSLDEKQFTVATKIDSAFTVLPAKIQKMTLKSVRQYLGELVESVPECEPRLLTHDQSPKKNMRHLLDAIVVLDASVKNIKPSHVDLLLKLGDGVHTDQLEDCMSVVYSKIDALIQL